MSDLQISDKHPLTEQYITLVGGGLKPYDAVMRLIGPALPMSEVQSVWFDWEMDSEVTARINAVIKERAEALTTVRNTAIESLVSILNQDIRRFFRKDEQGKVAVVPVNEWTKGMSSSVKKFKFTQKVDPFGNTTDTFNIEFHSLFDAIKELRELAPEVFEVVKIDGDAINTVALEKLTDEELDELYTKLLKAV